MQPALKLRLLIVIQLNVQREVLMSKKQNKGVESGKFDDYLKEAQSWETSQISDLKKSENRAWKVSVASVVVGLLGIAAATAALFRDPPDPVLIRVDNSTGIVDVVSTIKHKDTNYEEVINKYWTQLYVRYREGYSRELADEFYTSVGLMSSRSEQDRYFQDFDPKNPKSPLRVYGDTAKVRIKIKGTSFIKPNVAFVRYTRSVERGSDRPEVSHWSASITFSYVGSPMKEKDRAINPLGFQVTEYRNDPDSTPDIKAPGADGK